MGEVIRLKGYPAVVEVERLETLAWAATDKAQVLVNKAEALDERVAEAVEAETESWARVYALFGGNVGRYERLRARRWAASAAKRTA
jgi:hypothetical protein